MVDFKHLQDSMENFVRVANIAFTTITVNRQRCNCVLETNQRN